MRSTPRPPTLITLTFLVLLSANAAEAPWKEYAARPDDWYRSEAGRRITTHILSWQSPLGSWPKNTKSSVQPFGGDAAALRGTFDNGATTDELRFLARAFRAAKEPRCEAAFLKGVDHILQAQYPTGGWPQYYPPGRSYHRHITFNDHSMVRLMRFLREVATSPAFDFVDAKRRQAAQTRFDRGVQCILQCQIKVNGKLTAWCAQHDELDYRPRPARTFELVSLSGSESVALVELLMSLEKPEPGVVQSIEAAVAWFESAKLTGLREEKVKDAKAPKGSNKVVVKDPAAKPMWARFYDIQTNQPIFSDRDGVAKSNLADIGFERRNGYAWLGYWPEKLLAKDYPAWRKRLGR